MKGIQLMKGKIKSFLFNTKIVKCACANTFRNPFHAIRMDKRLIVPLAQRRNGICFSIYIIREIYSQTFKLNYKQYCEQWNSQVFYFCYSRDLLYTCISHILINIITKKYHLFIYECDALVTYKLNVYDISASEIIPNQGRQESEVCM